MALVWWDASPWLSGLCAWDFMPYTDASGTEDFQTVRQVKTLALAHALHACVERSGVPTGVLHDSVRELQRCMAPLMYLSGDEIVEASLLESAGKECRASPTSEEEANLLGEGPEPLETPKATSLLEHPEIPEPMESSECIDTQPTEFIKQTDALTTSPLPSPMPQTSCYPFWKAKKHWREIGVDQNHTGEWIHSYLQKNEWVPDWWREF